jgi:hypothetical protein
MIDFQQQYVSSFNRSMVQAALEMGVWRDVRRHQLPTSDDTTPS